MVESRIYGIRTCLPVFRPYVVPKRLYALLQEFSLLQSGHSQRGDKNQPTTNTQYLAQEQRRNRIFPAEMSRDQLRQKT